MNKQSTLSVELPNLVTTKFELSSANVQIRRGEANLVTPQLILEGEADDFEHDFRNGLLTVQEKPQDIVNIDQTGGSISVFSNIRAGGSITINGVSISGANIAMSNPSSLQRRALLFIPSSNFSIAHTIDTIDGDVEAEGLTAEMLKIVTMSGQIALRESEIQMITIKAMSGGVAIKNTKSPKPISVKTMSGDVTVEGSTAASWKLSTMSGDVVIRSTSGRVDRSSMSGSTSIS